MKKYFRNSTQQLSTEFHRFPFRSRLAELPNLPFNMLWQSMAGNHRQRVLNLVVNPPIIPGMLATGMCARRLSVHF
jgi:hypothetical protein